MAKNILDLAADFSDLMPAEEKEPVKGNEPAKEPEDCNNQSVQVKKILTRHQIQRIASELALEKVLPWHFEQGVSYHCISFGDVDSLTYFRAIVKQQKIRYALISTWVMCSDSISELRNWLERGYIGRCDLYIGEIFKSSYYKQYEEIYALCKDLGGRVAICRNHSKVMVLLGERFDAVIESSANVNHNPRMEQTCVTVDSELAHWYKEIFDGIVSYERDFDEVKPWQP